MTSMKSSHPAISIANYAEEQIIFNKGEEARDIFIIQDGQVEVFDPETGRRIGLLGRGHLIGEQALFQLGVRVASVRAKGEVRCQQLPVDHVRRLISSETIPIKAGIEGLCLQLATLNHFSAPPTGKGEKPLVRSSLGSWSSNQAQEFLKTIINHGDSAESYSPEELLYIKTLALLTPRTMLFSEAHWNSSSGPEQAFMILDGEVSAMWGSKTITIGRGAVFGLAESILGRPQLTTNRALSPLRAQVFPVNAMVANLSRTNAGVAGICRALALKIVDAYADQQQVLIEGI